MRGQDNRVAHVAFALAVSIFGLVISIILLGNPPPLYAGFDERRILVAFVYGVVCIAGMLAALFPVACSGILRIRRSTEDLRGLETRATKILGASLLHGHHAEGSETLGHELRLGGKSFCASCFGLLTGAALSLTLVTVFAATGWPGWADIHLAYVLYSLGVVGVVLGLVQAHVLRTRARIRFIIAVVFVVGTSLMLISTDLVTANVMADLFVVLLAVFWLLSRISLSHRS